MATSTAALGPNTPNWVAQQNAEWQGFYNSLLRKEPEPLGKLVYFLETILEEDPVDSPTKDTHHPQDHFDAPLFGTYVCGSEVFRHFSCCLLKRGE